MRKKIIKINDPIHGFIIFPEFMTKIVDSQEFQRLIRIRQLSGANHVFPGANHTRFEHSLGVSKLAQQLIQNLRDLNGVELDENDINDCVVAAMCHDLGHGPFSHNFEGFFLEHNGKDHEDYSEWLIQKSEIGDILEDLSFDKNYISDIATGRIIGQGDVKGSILSQVITSAINVDSMDYLLRDNYHCGTKGRSVDVDRLLISMDVMEGGILGVDIRSLIALEGFLLSRISSFRTIYFHKTCRAFQIMLSAAIKTIVEDIGLLAYKTPEDFLKWDDYVLWAELVKNPLSQDIMHKIQHRELFKCAYESKIAMVGQNLTENQLLDQLSEKSGVSATDIYIDRPSSSNVPYSRVDSTRPNEIYAFKLSKTGEKDRVRLEDHSIFFDQFKGNLETLRIYSLPKYRNQLTKAAIQILGKPQGSS